MTINSLRPRESLDDVVDEAIAEIGLVGAGRILAKRQYGYRWPRVVAAVASANVGRLGVGKRKLKRRQSIRGLVLRLWFFNRRPSPQISTKSLRLGCRFNIQP